MTSWRKGAKDSVIEPKPCTIETKVPEINIQIYKKCWVEFRNLSESIFAIHCEIVKLVAKTKKYVL